MPSIVLTKSQSDAVDRALDSIQRRKDLFRIGGFAGVGKSTLARSIMDARYGAAVCAFTGKAASVLRRKGLKEASTIHKLIYHYDEATKLFKKKNRKELAYVDYIILDEASMVNTEQWRDLQSFGKPIIAIGDPGQLQPVGDDPRLMVNPDIVLTEIHRQDAESAIIQFATHVRHGKPIRRGKKGEVEIGGKDLFWSSLEWADVLLCGRNRTRVAVNVERRRLKYGKDAIAYRLLEGDQIVCLKNNDKLQVSNGELFTVDRIHRSSDYGWVCDLQDCDEQIKEGVVISDEAFGVPKPDSNGFRDKEILYADYGYCLSVHKFQGSEADKVAVISEQCDVWCPIRHAYTAITRAAKELRYSI